MKRNCAVRFLMMNTYWGLHRVLMSMSIDYRKDSHLKVTKENEV